MVGKVIRMLKFNLNLRFRIFEGEFCFKKSALFRALFSFPRCKSNNIFISIYLIYRVSKFRVGRVFIDNSSLFVDEKVINPLSQTIRIQFHFDFLLQIKISL